MNRKPFKPEDLFGDDDPGCWFDFSDDEFTSRDEQGNYVFHDKLGRADPIVISAEHVVEGVDGRAIVVEGEEELKL